MKGVFKDRARDTGILVIQWNERVPRRDRYVERDLGIADLRLSKRILSLELATVETREALKSSASIAFSLQPLIENLENRKGALDQLCNRRCAFHVQDRERTARGREALGQSGRRRMVPDGKILQSAVAVKTNAPCANSSDRHGNLRGVYSTVGSLRAGTKQFFGGI